MTDETTDADDGFDEWYDAKSELMQEILGPEHDRVMHAIIPYALGGSLDLYYYPHCNPGTAVATKELTEVPEVAPSNGPFDLYELVMFTKHPVDLDAASDPETPFGRVHHSINLLLNHMARYAAMATLNPGETCEFPADMEHVGGKCVIFTEIDTKTTPDGKTFGLLAIIEVFPSEMHFAMQNGSEELFERLYKAGHYPYSDLERPAVA